MSEQRPFEVGDVVYVVGHRSISRSKVERVTKTQAITASGGRYRIRDGRMVGADTWSSRRIEHPTPHLDRQWLESRVSVARSRLVHAVERGTPSDIRAAFAVWDKLEKEVNGE